MLSYVIEADRLVKFYGRAKEPALDELGLKAPEGKIFTLLGRNGAGKTSFLRIATTQLLPTSGSIHVFGLDALSHPREIRSRTSGGGLRGVCELARAPVFHGGLPPAGAVQGQVEGKLRKSRPVGPGVMSDAMAR